MKELLEQLKQYRRESILAPLFKMLEAGFELFVPLVVAAMIDTGIAKRDPAFLWRSSGLLLLLALIGLVCSITAQYFAARAAVGAAAGLRRELFRKIQSLSFTEMDQLGTSAMLTRMTSDINQVQNGVNLVLRLFLRSPFIVFGAMIMAFTIDVPMALIFVVVIPLLALVVFGVMLACIPLYRAVQQKLDEVLGVTRENLTGIRVIRAFCKEKQEIRRFAGKNQELTHMQKYVGRISALMNPLTYVLINGAVLVLIWKGALRVEAGVLTQGQVVALYNYMSQILVELIKLANLIINVTKAVACANRIHGVFTLDVCQEKQIDRRERTVRDRERVCAAKAGTVPCVEFRHVGMTYAGAGEEALSDISFAAYPGQTIGIIGGTGSGKSSLVQLIPRFYEHTRGEILVDGRPVEDYPEEELRGKVGMVPQKAVLFEGTIAENLRWGKPEADEKELWAALEAAQAREVVEKKEGGLLAKVAQGGKNFSGGQRQRLTIARALVRKPGILILDDSSSALDYATDLKLRKALQFLDPKPCIFVVSQRTASIAHADLILVLEDGKLAGLGTHEELLAACEVYREIYESQYADPSGEVSRS